MLEFLRSAAQALRNVFESRKTWSDHSLADWFGGTAKATSGAIVNDSTALQLNAFYCCVRVIANGVAMLPLGVYRRLPNGGREQAREHPLWSVLHDSPNPWMTSFTFRQTMTGWAVRKNAAYAEKEFNGAGQVARLWPIPTPLVEPVITDAGDLVYDVTVPGVARRQRLEAERIFKWTGFSPDGVNGYDVAQLHREAVGMGLTIQEYTNRYFGNGSRPGGIITVEGKLGEDGRKRLKAGWEAAQGGLKNSHRVAVLENGAKWNAMGSSNTDSQLIDLWGKSRKEIAALFGVPLSKIQDIENASYATLEQEDMSFMVHCLGPWLESFEAECRMQLFSERDRALFFAKHKMQAAQRGDFKGRVEGYRTLWNIGAISNDEIRALEEMNPLPEEKGGDFVIPLNMQAIPRGGAATMPSVAQIGALQGLVKDVAKGEIPEESAIKLALVICPTMDEAAARALFHPAALFAEDSPPPDSPKPAEDPTVPVDPALQDGDPAGPPTEAPLAQS